MKWKKKLVLCVSGAFCRFRSYSSPSAGWSISILFRFLFGSFARQRLTAYDFRMISMRSNGTVVHLSGSIKRCLLLSFFLFLNFDCSYKAGSWNLRGFLLILCAFHSQRTLKWTQHGVECVWIVHLCVCRNAQTQTHTRTTHERFCSYALSSITLYLLHVFIDVMYTYTMLFYTQLMLRQMRTRACCHQFLYFFSLFPSFIHLLPTFSRLCVCLIFFNLFFIHFRGHADRNTQTALPKHRIVYSVLFFVLFYSLHLIVCFISFRFSLLCIVSTMLA